MVSKLLYTRIDNSPLLLFRIFFGLLVALESFGAILTGWVKRTLIDPKFTFNFIGFDWLQPLPGNGMYVYFFIMGVLGICIMLGYKYRFSTISFTILWAAVYLMQKTSYNNHYYLLVLTSFIMCFLPAHKNYAIDAKNNPSIKEQTMFAYVKWIIVLQLFIVYTFASIAKLYSDWLDFRILKLFMSTKADYIIIGDLLQQPWVHTFMGFTGIFFDLLIVPALLWKPTRKFAFIIAICFHLFNAIVFQIGIFPFLSIAFMVFFFAPETIRSIFFKKKTPVTPIITGETPYKSFLYIFGGIYFLVQIFMPIRHHLIDGDVLWTEEGHRHSWRMMLRTRHGQIAYRIKNIDTKAETLINLKDYLTLKQESKIGAYPDFIWQFAQYLKKVYATKGEKIEVYVDSKVSINGKPYQPFINPKVDLANSKWHYFRHNDWIMKQESKD